MSVYSISDLAELTGVKPHTLRVWEKRYGLLCPQRTDTNIRYYLDNDLKRLMLVVHLYQHGIKISRIAEMSIEEMEAENRKLAENGKDDEVLLQQLLIKLDTPGMDALIDRNIRQNGFETTLIQLILPMLDRMELMWLSGDIEEAHEACFRELIKRKTIREIDALDVRPNGAKIVMFLPTGNLQELSHLFMHYFLRKQGLTVTDLGCQISTSCATCAIKNAKADCVLIVNADPVHWQFGHFIRDLVQHTAVPIIISGRASDDDWNKYHGQVIVIDTIDETIRFVSRLKENLQRHLS